MAQLLNARQGGEYIFGGSDSANPPIPDAGGISASGMATQIAAAVAGLVPGGAAAVAAATLAAASSDAPGFTPFSNFLSDPLTGLTEARRGMPADDGPRVAFGLFANRNAAVVSAGETTGSWARDVLRGLATLASLDPAQVTLGQDFQALVATARESLRSGIEAMAQERGLLGAVEQRIEAVRGAHADISITLKLQLSDIEEIDPAQAISALQATQIQLQASYQVIASAGSLSLTQFLR